MPFFFTPNSENQTRQTSSKAKNVEQPYVTEVDLSHSLIPDEIIDQLMETLPPHNGPTLIEDRHLTPFDYITFMDKFIGHGQQTHSRSNSGGAGLNGNGQRN